MLAIGRALMSDVLGACGSAEQATLEYANRDIPAPRTRPYATAACACCTERDG